MAAGFSAGVYKLEESKGITEQLEDGGIHLSTIDTAIWSYSHFDHTGDMSKCPNSTNLVIDPGTVTSTYPQNPNADFAGRNVEELDFSSSKLSFSGLKVHRLLQGQKPPFAGYPSTSPRVLPNFVEKIATFKADPNIFVVISDDISFRGSIPLFPESLDDWKRKDLKENLTFWNKKPRHVH
ncbi:hypothetical protein FB45DRAFT_1019221 [Roridomyces roridus]|uniref:Metallo-beta-lactamase domain-containing protein n=1 Tax=Roridomyces roridus TaxID=1738132 RepID=A0AAD7G042_9AGAR|nr:hypothetical protein FB45DRAFT_1019221 [Roridomyces roridus]